MGFITDFFNWLAEQVIELFVSVFANIGENVFHIEDAIGKTMPLENIQKLFDFTQSVAISFVVIKVLQKGFFTYILWRDGDPDAPISGMIQNMVLAIVASVGFPTLYDIYADVAKWLIENYTRLLMQSIDIDIWSVGFGALLATSGILGIVILIYGIMLFVLYLQFLKRGAELLILRIGFPLACVGLLDSDKGVFTATLKAILQVTLTTIVQLFFMVLSMAIFVSKEAFSFADLCVALSCCTAAFSVPQMLQFILLQSQGGGGLQKVGSVAHTVSAIKSVIGK